MMRVGGTMLLGAWYRKPAAPGRDYGSGNNGNQPGITNAAADWRRRRFWPADDFRKLRAAAGARRTFYVDAEGDGAAGRQSPASAWRTIRAAARAGGG